MQEIIVATSNEHKIKEFKEILPDKIILSLNDINLNSLNIDENGITFKENAIIKARTVCNILNKTVIADDSGLVIDYLNGEPGIYSSRYLGKDTPYNLKNKIILERMGNTLNRSARFICAMAVAFPDGRDFVVEGVFEGEISKEILGENGFGYDPIFYLKEFNKTAAQIEPMLKNTISHRAKAMKKILDVLNNEGKYD